MLISVKPAAGVPCQRSEKGIVWFLD